MTTLPEGQQQEQERLECSCNLGCVCSCGPFVGVAVTAFAVGAIVGGGSAAFNAVISNPASAPPAEPL
jgi:hypothetical protein